MKPETGGINHKSTYVMGVDLASMGEDSSVYIVIEQPMDSRDIYIVYIEETNKTKLTDPVDRIMFLHNKFNFKKIYIDYTGLGRGPVDTLQDPSRLGNYLVEGITFTSQGSQNKIDMYSNLYGLLSSGRLHIPKNDKLIYQLLELQYEINDNKHIKIHHPEKSHAHDDYPDALALACLFWKGDKEDKGYSWSIS